MVGWAMPINRLLKDGEYTPDELERLNKAFSLALRSLSLVDRNDPLCETIARKVIEMAAESGQDPRQIADRAVKGIGLS
jgi:hypothetical protein